MSWFSRRRRGNAGNASAAVEHVDPPLAPVEEVVRQGVMIAEVSVRMAAKNFIIMNAMGDQASYDEAAVMRAVREELASIADEKHEDAERVQAARTKGHGKFAAWVRHGDAVFDEPEVPTRRQEVYELLAAQLNRLREDDDYVRATAEEARQDAWLELSRSFENMLKGDPLRRNVDADYWNKRDVRIQYLIDKDLAKLARKQQKKL
ncbi:hypothetical protein [Lysinibacter cavernae]|uniref:Asparagine synthase n=1 Tax=Lysinibacter cavernae TaxID=1640652 RepID=A0A7X5TSR0_9MICO|nr:hypothetical protein [Lysinibacter cavernae]NIH53320.1 hypothetical protein [Lysinibacter cavernae]